MGSQGGKDSQQGCNWRTRAGKAAASELGGPTFACRQTRRNSWGVRQTTQPRAPAQGNKASKPLTENPCGGWGSSGRNSQLTGEFIGETYRGLECTQTHPHVNQHQKGLICLWVAGDVTESQPRAEQVALFPL